MALPISLKPFAAALGGLTVAFGVGIGLVRLSPVPAVDPQANVAACKDGDCGPTFTVEEVTAELVTMSRVEPASATRLAAAILAAASDAHQSTEVTEDAWVQAHEGAYVQVKFGRMPVLPAGPDRRPVPVSHVVFGFRPVRIVVRSGQDLYQYRAPKYASLVRVQRFLAELIPSYSEPPDDADPTFDRFAGVREEE